MGAKVKGQGHKVTLDENAQLAENVVNARICKWHDIVKIHCNSSIHPTYFLPTRQ